MRRPLDRHAPRPHGRRGAGRALLLEGVHRDASTVLADAGFDVDRRAGAGRRAEAFMTLPVPMDLPLPLGNGCTPDHAVASAPITWRAVAERGAGDGEHHRAGRGR